MKNITVYCSSSVSLDTKFMDAARLLGQEMARRKLALVYGGGSIGLMGEIARTMKSAGGKVVGVITKRLLDLEQGYDQCDELIVVDTMAQRKTLMAQRGDAFIALPGGLGTFEELFEVWTWRQLGFHNKPIGLLNVANYYDGLQQFLQSTVQQGFLSDWQMDFIHQSTDADSLLPQLIGAAGLAKSDGLAQI
jgi:uncharacterized protein (TIGR00730 family)